jgi:hypothetical protein
VKAAKGAETEAKTIVVAWAFLRTWGPVLKALESKCLTEKERGVRVMFGWLQEIFTQRITLYAQGALLTWEPKAFRELAYQMERTP